MEINRGDWSQVKCKHCGNSDHTKDKCYGRSRDMGAVARLAARSDPKFDASQSLSYTASGHVFTSTTNPYCCFRCDSPYLPIGWLLHQVFDDRHPTSICLHLHIFCSRLYITLPRHKDALALWVQCCYQVSPLHKVITPRDKYQPSSIIQQQQWR